MTDWIGGDVVSQALAVAGLAVLAIAVAYLLGQVCSAADRSIRAWALATRHARRASTARAAARASRARVVRDQSCGAYDALRRTRSDER